MNLQLNRRPLKMDRDPNRTECQKDLIFLLQRRIYNIASLPGWLGYDDEGDLRFVPTAITRENCPDNWPFIDDDGIVDQNVCLEWLRDNPPDDGAYVEDVWITETVWLTRTEAERYAEAHSYRYPQGVGVFCISAMGELAKLLASADPR
jgi:hypothetical protein